MVGDRPQLQPMTATPATVFHFTNLTAIFSHYPRHHVLNFTRTWHPTSRFSYAQLSLTSNMPGIKHHQFGGQAQLMSNANVPPSRERPGL